MRLAVPDLISNSYFPAVAAVELGFCKAEGLDVELELLFPVPKTMEALREDPSRATEVGRRLFPPTEAELIAELIRRDLPYYDPVISPDVVTGVNRFARDVGLLSGPVPYEDVVATPFLPLWQQST